MATNAVIIDNIAGISIKSFREIRQAIATSFTEVFGASINLEPSSPDGMLVDLLAYLYTELAQALQTIGANMDVTVATILFLDASIFGRVPVVEALRREMDKMLRTVIFCRFENVILT